MQNSRPAEAAQAEVVAVAAQPEVVAVPPGEIEGLREEWRALWQRCPSATPFQAPEWLLSWGRTHAPGRTAAVTLRVGGRLAGVLPVFCWEGAMLLAGTGPSDYGDLLIEPGQEAMVTALIAALPRLSCGEWRRIDLKQVPAGSPLLAALPRGWSEQLLAGDPCFVAPLVGKDGLGALSPRRRANWHYAMRRLWREGGTIGLVAADGVADAVGDLIRLHELRWQARGETGVFADPLYEAFLREAAPALAASGLLRLHELRLGGVRAAVLMVLAGRGAHHYCIGGFDPAHGRLSPSAVLVGAAMVQAAREGAAAFDFLRGAEEYKHAWGARERETGRRILTPP